MDIDKVFGEINVFNPGIHSVEFGLPESPTLAREFYKKTVEMITNFETMINDDEEVGVRLVTFEQTVEFYIEHLHYKNPSLLTFIGTLKNGSRFELIQNDSDISFLLMVLPKQYKGVAARRFGFKKNDVNHFAFTGSNLNIPVKNAKLVLLLQALQWRLGCAFFKTKGQ